MKVVTALLLTVAACGSPGSHVELDAGSDSHAAADAASLDAPAKPKPQFTAQYEIGGQLAITDTGIRPTFSSGGSQYPSIVQLSLTAANATTSCGVTLAPAFVGFGSAHTSTRTFKTVELDFATSQVVQNNCGWDEAWIASQLGVEFGTYVVGFAQARFDTDRPNVDVYFDAASGFGDNANIVAAGGGTAYQMMDDGTVTQTVIEPAPGTLLPGAYLF